MRVDVDDRVEPAGVAGDDQPPRAPRPIGPWLAGLGIVAALVLGVAALMRAGDQPVTQSPAQISSTVSSLVGAAVAAAANAPAPGTAVFQAIQPSIVYISSTRAGAAPGDTSSGAGVVVNAQGQVITALHVVAGAQTIEVTFADGTQTTAQIASQQADTDIAVLTPDQPPSVIVPAVLGGGVRIGDDVFAVGHPLGLVDSLTAGVVSGLDRAVPIAGGQPLRGLIQFDAAVNPGSSGGPLLNRAGQVVGIVTALANPSDQTFFVGIGFAVPIATAGGAAGAPQR
ncbi:MAG: peptidase and chymotrypsin/Hap [Ilumatobacteraceae bacterium]|nr:peptidase and chymotrypsin/Hap [Ilumatobacteraceae bacterium]